MTTGGAMLRRRHRQGSFWDTEWIEHLIDEESFEWHFRRVVRPLISDDDFAWAYSPDRGRKAIPPSLVACALILQQRHIRFNLALNEKMELSAGAGGEGAETECISSRRRWSVSHCQEP